MKLKASVLGLLLALIIRLGCFYDLYINRYNFYNLEKTIKQESIFVENAVKIQYRTRKLIGTESKKIQKLFNGYTSEVKIDKNSEEINLFCDKQDISAHLWSEDKWSYVEIILVNKNKKYTTKDIYKMLSIIKDSSMDDLEYFLYYKGKVEKNTLNTLLNKENINNLNLLSISNGYTGVGYLENNQKINFAQVKYDTGLYIIIATPIIFMTY